MKKTSSLILSFLVLMSLCLFMAKPVAATTPIENTWVEMAPLQQPRGALSVVAVDGAIFAIGGSTSEYPSSTGSGGF